MINHYLKPASHPALQWNKPAAPLIQQLSLPATLHLPLSRGINDDALLVDTGSKVLRGQPLTQSNDLRFPPVLASSSGTVTAISNRTIEIHTDGTDTCIERHFQDKPLTRVQLIQAAHNAGLTGQGGAGFPVAGKLHSLPARAQLLLVNAAECDPAIHCDDALIQQRTPEIVEAITRIALCCAIDRIYLGIEAHRQKAIDALQHQLQQKQPGVPAIQLCVVPERYPSGAERTLLTLCTGSVPDNHQPLSTSGILSMNIASCYALGQVLATGMPCTERVTTVVTPDQPIANYCLRLGTRLDTLFETITGNTTPPGTITVGGRMMPAQAQPSDVITQSSNCIIFSEGLPDTASRPCIRCGVCADVCPQHLMPQHLHRFALHFDQSQLTQYRIDQCIECRCCDVVCPSHIPLAQQFRIAKHRIKQTQQNEASAALAKQRFEKRQQRLANKKPRKKLRTKPSQTPRTTATPADSRKALIEAALARSRSKGSQSGDPS